MIHYRHGALRDDRSMIVLVIDKVDGAATKLRAGGEHRFVDTLAIHPSAAKRRDQRRVNVHDACMIGRGNLETFQETGANYVVGFCFVARRENLLAEIRDLLKR